jgi:4,5-DOPA dioxygenase extradiol
MRLAPLRERGVLILGSGNVVHNLPTIDWGARDTGFDWAHRFNESIKSVVTENPERILEAPNHADFAKSVPTPDHFIPLLYLAGLAYATGHTLRPLIDGYAMGSLSMASYTLDATILPWVLPRTPD